MVTNYRCQITLAPHVRDQLDELARRRGMTRSALLAMLVTDEYSRQTGKGANGHAEGETGE